MADTLATSAPDTAEVAPSPYASPEYGREGEGGGEHVIASKPRVSLEENQSMLTGYMGAGMVIACAILDVQLVNSGSKLPENLASLQGLADRLYMWRHVVFILMVWMTMFISETVILKTHRRQFDFENPRVVDGEAWKRIWLRWVATAFCVLAATFLYFFFLGEYSFFSFDLGAVLGEGRSLNKMRPFFYGRYVIFYVFAMPTLLVACVPYYWLVERHARPNGPIDEFLVLGRCLQRISLWAQQGLFSPALRADAWKAFRNPHLPNLARGLFVKFFFIPLMMLWSLDIWANWEMSTHHFFHVQPKVNWADMGQVAVAMRSFHHMAFNMLIMLDLNCALAGYCISMRLLDNQITTAEPTLLGWVAALACYPPFNQRITGLYFYYEASTHGGMSIWEDRLADYPHLTIFASFMMLLLMGIYTWATIAFGLRFSNLTNRGMVCKGPYRVVRHPAYICKNMAWWFEYLPFMAGDPLRAFVLSIHLLGVNAIYTLRAFTEERHLMREEQYREYCKKVPWRFIPGVF